MTWLFDIPPREAWEGVGANDLRLMLSVTHVNGMDQGFVYQTCDVSQLLEDLAPEDELRRFLIHCAKKLVEETTIYLVLNDPWWNVKDMTWEFAMNRTAPGDRGDYPFEGGDVE